MDDVPLSGARILVVEDEVIIALELQTLLTEAGAVVVGPARTLLAADTLARNEVLSAALLDVQVGDHAIFPIAEFLAERGIPFAFHTGHGDGHSLSVNWPQAEVLTKPSRATLIIQAMTRLVRRRARSQRRLR
jgi:DNA-binding NtrC family response regulator